MDVFLDEMRAGADRAYQAAAFATEAAQQLSRGCVRPGIFGSFGAAEGFRTALSAAHSNHQLGLHGQRERLGALGDTAHTTATAFAETEDRNAAALRAVR